MYNAELVRQLCAEILTEKDKPRAEELIALLQAVIKEDQKKSESEWRFLPRSILTC